MTQREMVMNHLEKYGSITPAEAWDKYNIYRLSSIVQRLRAKGAPIITENVECGGENGHYGRYVLERRNNT